MRKTPREIKKKVLKAISKGATKPQLLKYVKEHTIYRALTKQERDMAKAKHEAIIDNIFS
jgi:hypothetical protein